MLLYILPESVESSGKIESISASKIPAKSTNNIINEPGQIGKRKNGALAMRHGHTYVETDSFPYTLDPQRVVGISAKNVVHTIQTNPFDKNLAHA